MAEAIYLMCAATSLLCAIMLARTWWSRRDRLLLWSLLCFAALTVNNVLLFVDLALAPQVDLGVLRTAAGLVGVSSLLAGLIWETT